MLYLLIPLLLITVATALFMAVSWVRNPRHAAAPPAVHSILSGNAAGHEITADIDTVGCIVDRHGVGGVAFLSHELVIEKERLLLDGKERAKIPAVASLKIVVSDTQLSVMANGKSALRTTIKR
jgi:hypothetical protein